MHLEAEGVWRIDGLVADCLNVYLVGDVLIDAATRWHERYLLRKLRHRPISLVALTHCHPDHQGAAWFLCRRFHVPLACHEADAPAAAGRELMRPRSFVVNWLGGVIAGRPHRVGRVLREGDDVAGFRVYHAPGHTPGQVIFFRERDRVAIVGDVLANLSFVTFRPGLRLPPSAFCTDPWENLRSVERLAALKPRTVLFGHGPPLRKPEQLQWFAERVRLKAARRANGPRA